MHALHVTMQDSYRRVRSTCICSSCALVTGKFIVRAK